MGFKTAYIIDRVGQVKILCFLTRWVGASKKGPKHAYVIYEWSLRHGHAGTSTSNDPCHDAYHGGKPFSDAESKAVRDALKTAMAEHNKKVIYISVHAYGQLWIYPYGHTKSQSIHHSDLKSVATVAVQALQ